MSDTEEKALIGRLEALEAPCRKVDMLIETLQTGNRQHPYLVGINIDDKPDAGRTTYPTPRYTASIDAAMTLVPEGSEWNIEKWAKNGVYTKHAKASAWVPGAERAYAVTPAIALCIAALRAQEDL